MKPRYIEYAFSNDFPKISSDIFYEYLGEEFFPAVITQLIGEYWSCLPFFDFKKLMPSLVCPASSEIYSSPCFDVDDPELDTTVYQQKVFQKYHHDFYEDKFVPPFIQLLRTYGCRLKLPEDIKRVSNNNDLEIGLLNDEEENKPFKELSKLLAVEHKKEINLASELKNRLHIAVHSRKGEFNLAELIYNYRFTLNYKIAFNKANFYRNTAPSFFSATYKAVLYSMYPQIGPRIPFGIIPNNMLVYASGFDYTRRRKYANLWDRTVKKPLIAAMAVGSYYCFLHPTLNQWTGGKKEITDLLSYGVGIAGATLTAFSDTLLVSSCADIILRERRMEFKNTETLPPFSWGAGLCMMISLSDKIFNLVALMEVVNQISTEDYRHYLFQAMGIARFICSLPTIYLASRQSGHEVEKYFFRRPPNIFEQDYDSAGFSDRLSYFRRLSRLLSSIFMGIIQYKISDGNVGRTLLSAAAELNFSYLQYPLARSSTLFRFPTEAYPQDTKEDNDEKNIEFKVTDLKS